MRKCFAVKYTKKNWFLSKGELSSYLDSFAMVEDVLERSIIEPAEKECYENQINHLLMRPFVIQSVIAAPLQAVNVSLEASS